MSNYSSNRRNYNNRNKLRKNANTSNGSNFDLMSFISANVKYIGAIACIVAIALTLAIAVSAMNGGSSSSEVDYSKINMSVAEEEYKEGGETEVVSLIESYYAAYAAGDTKAVGDIAKPLSDREASYIAFFSQYIEEYNNISVYTKPGGLKGAYLTSVKVDTKLVDIETSVPSLDFFYVETDEDGEVYINNIYSSFNLSLQEVTPDENVVNLINSFKEQDDYKVLYYDVTNSYTHAVNSDANLSTFLDVTLPERVSEWQANYEAEAEAKRQAEEAEKAAQAAQEAAQQAADNSADTQQEQTQTEPVIVTVNDGGVNVRNAPSADADAIGSLNTGDQLTLLGIEGEWAKVDLYGQEGYIKSEFLNGLEAVQQTQDAGPEQQQQQVTSSEPRQVQLSDAVNIRESRDQNSRRVALAYASEIVTVTESYDDGWSKVNYNGQEGYARTDLLQ